MDDRLTDALNACDRTTFAGDAADLEAAERGLDALSADIALTRGRVLHARYLAGAAADVDPAELDLFEQAARLYDSLADHRGEGTALFWIGCFHQVVRDDHDAATEPLSRAGEIADRLGDVELMSYVLRHQGISEHVAGRLESAAQLLEKSTDLRRQLGMPAGVAANLVGLAYIAHAQGDIDRASALLDEGTRLADDAGAAAIRRQLDEARKVVSGSTA